MNITFSSVGTQGGTDAQSSSTGPTKGQDNAIFANFSNLLMSAPEEGLGSNSSSEILNVHLSGFDDRSLGEVSAQEFMNQIISDDSMLVDRKLQVMMAEHGVDGLVSHLENGGNLDASVHFNATAAFMDTKIGALTANNIVDKDASGLTLSTFMDLLSAIDLSDNMKTPDGVDDSFNDLNKLDASNIVKLNDLMVSAPVHLELSDAAESSILFDIRDLKNNLGEMLALDSNELGSDLTPSEVLIPQIIPISADTVINTEMVINTDSAISADSAINYDDVADIDDEVAISSNQVYALMDEYDPFVSVKVELLDSRGKLGATEHIELPPHPDQEVGLNIVGVTRTVEIDANVDPRSKLLVGLSIPENTSLHDLPDFVRFKIRLSKNSSPDVRSEVEGKHGLNSISKELIISGDKSTLEITKIAQQLVSSLQEMSTLSSRPTQIVVKTAAAEPMIPSFNMQNMVPLGINKLVLTDINEASALKDAESISANQMHTKVMFDEIVKPVASMNNDARIGVATSALALDTELKYFLNKKDFKNNFFTKEIESDLVEQNNVSTKFNPKFFLEAVETLRVKQVTLSNLAPKVEQQLFGQSDSNSFTFTKVDSQTAVQASSSNNPMAPAPSMSGKISLYDAQYASRISMLVVDKVLNGKENFEIHLEPESFGKIKVNVLMEKQVLDIRMVAETQAAASLLRANEESLLQITNQNGMKLVGFSVGMQSGTDQQRQNSNQNRNRLTDQANSVLGLDKIQNSQTIISYRTSTGLNLIA